MPYSLECAGSLQSSDATEAEINRALADDKARGEFIILTAPNGDFMQAANEGDSPFVLEHRMKATGEHMQADGELSKDEVRQAFLTFLRSDPSWRPDRTWQPLAQRKSGCMGVILLAVSIGWIAAIRLAS